MTYPPAGGVGLDPGGPVPSGPSVPPPPPGPGAAPPFASPPTERDKKRMWIGLGIGALVLVLCCAGGIGGIGIVLVNGVEQSKRQAELTVEYFLDAVQAGDSREARGYVCEDLGRGLSAATLESRASDTGFTGYDIGEAQVRSTLDVPVTLDTASGAVRQWYLVGSEGTASCIVDILAR